MNELRDGARQIADATDERGRAAALLDCPLSIPMTCEFTIRNRLMAAGFRAGLAYLDSELAVLPHGCEEAP
ncbi:hypothetical protein LXM94_23780 [Rhizobium sp. TRM95111]|uniref:hypothetical protein n=1 Tax=Rhizobium alarense TaxID=2846851 RepID=UPI001F186E49|nr:hypothetical protein [Rhizobium alarense]MCF3642988.1 hypothetical protein [Rhizobium alarense]